MNRKRWLIVAAAAIAAVMIVFVVRTQRGSVPPSTSAVQAEPEPQVDRVREPAVAGPPGRGFYLDDSDELAEMIDGFLQKVETPRIERLRALVCPHAGYAYSGQTAAFCYQQLVGREVKTVVILAPSHRERFEGVSIPDVDAYRTPLGLVLLSREVNRFAGATPFTSYAAAHEQEHSLEVQLPFLQRVLKGIKIVPMVFGWVDPVQVGTALARKLGERTIVVASSDLSHFHPYEEAQKLDRSAIDAILGLDLKRMQDEQACGKGPVLALMSLAKQKGWKSKLLDYRNSGDTAGTKSRVVGYAAIAFYAASGKQASGG